ncbi:HD domain-containing phosphohydrolase [Salsipaludibacter albus]|uniref:HD domain-containing phosphohydrolase n=1 Tax=Salsipaludibacter albus TaxID=2849650 RepID=UPI00236789E1|nr:HD domain-containing phosphohydrolase [Salsipaludibacter albus]MBY5162153.1 LuxR C-terminal-related transcriptional regulator [Salsipaludibacter albus]
MAGRRPEPGIGVGWCRPAIGGALSLRLVDLLAGLSRVADLGFGLPAGESLRSAALAVLLADELDLDDEHARAGLYTALLQHLGCIGFAHEAAARVGDEFAINRAALQSDDADPLDVVRTFLPALVAGRSPRRGAVLAWRMLRAGPDFERDYVTTACEVGRHVAVDLGLPGDVRDGLSHVYELWQGGGHPDGLAGDDLPMGSRLARLSGIAVAHARTGGTDAAVAAVTRRAGGMLDPTLAAAFVADAPLLLDLLDTGDPLAVVRDHEPDPHQRVLEPDLVAVATVFGDVADLKSPHTVGHSRGVARLASGAADVLGLPDVEVERLRLAGHLHDLGRVAVSSRTWDRPGPLDATAWEQVRLHPYHSERILAGSGRLGDLASLVGAHHERLDGSGYHRGCDATQLSVPARVLAAADRYRTAVEPRPHRRAATPDAARDGLQVMADDGRLDPEATAAVLVAAGHAVDPVTPEPPAGLTPREVEVLRLVATGCSNREIGDRLVISRRTAEHHVQHVYRKLGVSSRAAATLFAVDHDLLERPGR